VQGQCGTSTTIDAYPGITPTQVDFGTISGLLVASDEQHVLIQRAEDSSYSSAPLAVVTVGPGGAGATCELTTKTWLDNGMARAGFTDDAAALFFVDDSVSPPALIVANADGSQQRTLATGMIQNAIARGSTLVYDFDPTSGGYAYQHWAVQLPSGTPVQLNSHLSAVEVPEQYVNSTGTATIISNGGATYSQDLVQTATGTDLQFTASSTIWSPDGTHLAYWQQPIYDLHVIDSDGTNDVVVLQAMASYPLWSPDGSAIAAKISDATGYAAHDVKVHYFDGRSQIALTSTDDISAGVLHFSGDGSVLFIEGVNSKALYFAPVKQGAAFTSLIADLQFSDPYDLEIPSFESTYSGDHVAAFVAGARSVVVAPVGAGTQITLPPQMGATPYYEPVNASPDLLTWVYTGYEMPGDLAVFPTDGSGTGVVLPGTVDFAVTMAQEEHPPPFGWEVQDLSGSPFTWGWLGSAVVYQLSGSAMGSDVVAATGRGSVAGVIAPGTKVWSASNMVNPTRIFFAQYGANGGLWWSPIPK
jgi:hypothetical protein